MALSYNLYQIGFVADTDTTVSYVQDSGISIASSLPLEEEGYGANDSEQIIELSGNSSNLDNSFKTDNNNVYLIINGELIWASFPGPNIEATGDFELSVLKRGTGGTPVQSHSAGDTIYQVDPERKDDVSVNTGLRRIKDVTDFSVEDVGQFEEAVEYEKGTFRVSNVSATVTGVDRHTLSDAGSIDKPWVFEVRDSGNSLLFQGILKDDAKFNAGTEKINFTAVSWLEILNRVESLPARVQYEADIKAVTVGDPTGEVTSDITVQFPSDPKFTNNFPSRGDTVAIETDKGEIRRIATEVNQGPEFTNAKIPVDDLFEDLVYSSKGTSNQVERGKLEEYSTKTGTAYYSEWRFKNLPTDLENTLTELSNPDKYRVLLFDSNDNIVEEIAVNKDLVNQDRFNEDWPKVFALKRNPIVQPEIPTHQYFVIVKNTGSQALLDKVSSAEAENKVKVLSQQMWGYEGIDDSDDNDGLTDYFDPQGLMDALFKTQEITYNGDYDGVLPTLRLGVLPKIMQSNGVVFGRGGPDDVFETIDPRVEFPTAPIEALRMIQQDTGTMLTVSTSTTTNAEGETIPSVQFELLPRQRLLDDANRVQLEDVTDWNEDTSERDVRAVVIEPNKQYGAGGDDQPEYLGIYTEQIDRNFSVSGETDFGSNGVPEGDDVIRIKTNHFPNGSGYTYREGDDPVVNDDHLREIARLYYKQFTEANRKVEFSVGKDNPDVLAKYVSIEEGRVVDDSVLVTQKRHYLEEDHRETSLVGRIGGRAKFGETAPVPDIRVPRAFRADSTDVASIFVSGRSSYDARPGTLSFQWEYKEVSASTWTSGGTGALLEEDITFTGGGTAVTYDVRLTVTNNNTGASAQATDQFVIKPYNELDDTTPSNEVDYDKQQVTKSGNRYGQINVTLANPELVQTDSNGNPLFEFRAAQGAEIDGSASWYRVGSGNSPEGSGQVVTDGNGNVTGFFAEVQLDPKHVSNIQTRIKWTETVDYANQVRSHAFDFDNEAKIESASVYTNANGDLAIDFTFDEDTDRVLVEYQKSSESSFTESGVSPLTTEVNSLEVTDPNSNVINLSNGQYADVSLTPQHDDNGTFISGNKVTQRTYYGATSGRPEFTRLTVLGDGDSATRDFRVQDGNGNDIMWVDDSGNVHATADVIAFSDGSGGGGSGSSSNFQLKDTGAVLSLDNTTDPDTLSLNYGNGLVENNGTLEVDGGSNVGSLSDLSDVSSATQSDGNVLASDGTSYSEEAVQSLFDNHVSLSASDVSGVSADSVADAHHTRPSAGDGLSELSNTFSVNESQVDHDSLNQFVSSEHVDHSAVTISAGTALSGGGDLTASRTLNVAGPFTGIPFKTSGDNLEWQADANNDLILQNTADAQTLLKVDQDTGTIFAAGDVVAFGLSGGSGTGSSGGFSIAGDGLTSPDGDTINVDYGAGLTIDNGVLKTDGSVGYSDSDAVDALQAHDGTNVDADTLDGVEGSSYARTDVNETFNNDLYVNGGNVGIGTTSPNAALDAYNPTNAVGEHGLVASAQYGAGNTYIARFDYRRPGDSNYDTKMVVRTDGNVGIGTTSPSYPLDVVGTAAASTVRLGDYTVTEDSSGILGFFHSGTRVLEIDDSGVLRAKSDVVAFGLTGGSSTSGGGGFSIAGDGLTSPDGETVEVDIGAGLTINNGVLEADGSVGVSSVFGRSGDVTAQTGDYSASQINNFDSSAVSALQSHDGTNVSADTLDGEDGSYYAALSENEIIGGSWVFDGGRVEIKTGETDRYVIFNSSTNDALRLYRQDSNSNVVSGDLEIYNNSGYKEVWHDGNADSKAVDALQAHDGTGVSADTLDGYGGNDLAALAENEEFTNGLNITGGRVGIGTTSPSQKVEIVDDGGTSDATFQIGGSVDSRYRARWLIDDKGLKFGHNSSSRDIQFQTGDTTKVTIGGGGDVGIGTTSPSYSLDVVGDINASGVGRFSITGDAESVDGLDGFQIARTDTSEIFTDQVRIDGPLAGSDNEIGNNDGFVLALGGKPYGVDDADGSGDDRLGDGLLQTAHGKASDYRTYLQGGHGRVAHVWNAYYDNGASTWRSVVGNEPHSLVGIGNGKPGNVTGGGVTLATADAVNTNNFDDEQDAEDPITWNVGLHVDVGGKVGIGGVTDPANALQVGGDMRATGEVEAFLGSDRRLKTDLNPLNSALDKVDKLTGYNFDWRDNDSVIPHKRGNRDVGVIAQEVEQVLPNAVQEFVDGHSKGYKSVSYDKLVPLLIEAIKDLRSQVEQLQ